MLVAKETNEKKVLARVSNKIDGPFYCPECENEVTLHKGRIKIHHFAHKVGSNCQYGIGESNLHRQCKEAIYNELIKNPDLVCTLEKGLGPVRPDIYIESKVTGKKEELGIYVLWVPVLNETKVQDNKQYAPKSWEKWLHALNFGSIYYWVNDLTIQQIKFDKYMLYVTETEYGGGYSRISKRYRTVRFEQILNFPSDFINKPRTAWAGGQIVIPQASILIHQH